MKKLLVSLGAIALTATPLTVLACSSDKDDNTDPVDPGTGDKTQLSEILKDTSIEVETEEDKINVEVISNKLIEANKDTSLAAEMFGIAISNDGKVEAIGMGDYEGNIEITIIVAGDPVDPAEAELQAAKDELRAIINGVGGEPEQSTNLIQAMAIAIWAVEEAEDATLELIQAAKENLEDAIASNDSDVAADKLKRAIDTLKELLTTVGMLPEHSNNLEEAIEEANKALESNDLDQIKTATTNLEAAIASNESDLENEKTVENK
ncbi:hypothetical protein [Mesoplasma photuris]|uniref:hypothetical protein n=1 Tax=Mesoplasma photuris TaxID=217731 RepID=UPI0004E21A09|nr:hypothetical protein [Mesoplasma photuris]